MLIFYKPHLYEILQRDYYRNFSEQLQLENSKKWRLQERDDWKALVDSVQRDRGRLQDECNAMERELAQAHEEIERLRAELSSTQLVGSDVAHPSHVNVSTPSHLATGGSPSPKRAPRQSPLPVRYFAVGDTEMEPDQGTAIVVVPNGSSNVEGLQGDLPDPAEDSTDRHSIHSDSPTHATPHPDNSVSAESGPVPDLFIDIPPHIASSPVRRGDSGEVGGAAQQELHMAGSPRAGMTSPSHGRGHVPTQAHAEGGCSDSLVSSQCSPGGRTRTLRAASCDDIVCESATPSPTNTVRDLRLEVADLTAEVC